MPTTELAAPSRRAAFWLTVIGGIGILVAFAATVTSFQVIEAAGTRAALAGSDIELGYPSSALTLVIFVVLAAVGAAMLAGAELGRAWWNAVVIVLSLGVIAEIWGMYLSFTVFHLVLFAVLVVGVVFTLRWTPYARPSLFGTVLVLASSVGFFAAFRLTVDKIGTFIDPTVAPSCNYSVLVQCGVNLKSWQGSLFGFPNPLIGVGGWVAVFVIGVMIIGGVKFSRWFWIAMNVGMLGALAFICWLIYTSIFALATLCPWCMVTWFVVIPSFWLVTLRNLKEGVFGLSPRARAFFAGAYGYIPLISLLCYVVIAILAQVRLDVIHRF